MTQKELSSFLKELLAPLIDKGVDIGVEIGLDVDCEDIDGIEKPPTVVFDLNNDVDRLFVPEMLLES